MLEIELSNLNSLAHNKLAISISPAYFLDIVSELFIDIHLKMEQFPYLIFTNNDEAATLLHADYNKIGTFICGWFNKKKSPIYLYEQVPKEYVQIFLGSGNLAEQENWSIPVPLKYVDSMKSLNRVLKMKTFY